MHVDTRTFSTVLASITLIILLFSTLLRRKKTRVIYSFIALLASALVWIIDLYVSNIRFSPTIDLITNRLVFGLVPVFSMSFYNIVISYEDTLPKKSIGSRVESIVFHLLLIVEIVLSFTPLIVKEISFSPVTHQYNIAPGQLYYLFVLPVAFSFFWAIWTLITMLRKVSGVARSQIALLAFATVILVVLTIISNSIVPRLTGSSDAASFAPFWVIIWLIFISYSIYRHRLFEINFILGRILYYVLNSIFLYGLFYAAYFMGQRYWGGSTTARAFTFGAFFAVFASFAVHYFITHVSRKVSDAITYITYNSESALKEITKKVSSTLDLELITSESLGILNQTVQPLVLGIVVFDKDAKKIVYHKLLPENSEQPIDDLEPLFSALSYWNKINHSVTLTRYELQENPNLDRSLRPILNFMRKNNIYLILPLNRKVSLNGILLLGEKENRFAYSNQDVSFLENMTSIISVAISRALLYTEVQAFAQTLEQKVKVATRQLRQRNDELQSLYKDLEDLYQKEKDLMDIAGHELRTPASIIKTNLYMLKDRLKEVYPQTQRDERIKKNIDRLLESTERQISMVNTFLESARIDNKKFELSIEVADLGELVNTAVEDSIPNAKKKNLKVVYTPIKTKMYVEMDKIRIREVVDNLISNAIKYTPQGYIEVKTSTTKDKAFFQVKDSGIGISPENQKNLFKKFSRVSQHIGGDEGSIVRPGGTGLGLYVSKSIIDAHKGKIGVDSAEGKGSTFHFEIPKKQGRTGASPLSQMVDKALKFVDKSSVQKVLVRQAATEKSRK